MARISKERLAELAEEEEARRDEAPRGPMHRLRRRAQDPAQVYSVRMPVEYLEELRRVAEEQGETPSTLMRRWMVEYLDARRASQQSEEITEVLNALRVLSERLPQLREEALELVRARSESKGTAAGRL